MTDKDYSDRENRFYTAIGAFTFEFEQLCLSIKNSIILLFEKNGLTKEIFVDILLYDSAAGSLRKYLAALIFECYKKDFETASSEKIFNSLYFKKIQEVIELRNNIVHSAWILAFDSTDNLNNDITFPIRNKLTNKGIKRNEDEYLYQDLIKYWENLKVLSALSLSIKENIENNKTPFYELDIEKLKILRFDFDLSKKAI
jgi:hypothetical protein